MSAYVLLKDSVGIMDASILILLFLMIFIYFRSLLRQEWISESRRVLYAPLLIGLMVFGAMIEGVKKYDQCLLVDVNFAAAIHRHMWEYESVPTYKGKGLGTRKPLPLGELHPEPCNVLVIVFESLRRQNTSLYGYQRKTTPHLQQFAKKNAQHFFRFEKAYTVSTTTMLAVPAILNGIGPYQDTTVFYRQPLIWEMANAASMETFFLSSHSMQWYHFDRFYEVGKPNFFWSKEESGQEFFNDLGINDVHTISKLNEQLKKPRQDPFFGVVQLNATHYPYHVPSKFSRWNGHFVDEYDNSILYQDELIGRMLKTLEENGLLKNTVIFFTSDHGEALKDHRNIGHVDNYYAETVSIPLMIYFPEAIMTKERRKALLRNQKQTTANIDIAPTILHLLDTKHSRSTEQVRKNYSGYSLFTPIPNDRMVITMNNNDIARFRVGLSAICGDYHYLHRMNIAPSSEELYRINTDPREQRTLSLAAIRKWKQDHLYRISNYPVCGRYLPAK